MRQSGILSSLGVFIVVLTAMTSPLMAGTGCFRGEIVSATDYGKISLLPAGSPSAMDAGVLGPHYPLNSGDILSVSGDTVVIIRDRPGGKTRRLTVADDPVIIGAEETCETRPAFQKTFGGMINATLGVILSGPVAEMPVPTYPRAISIAGGVELPFEDPQYLAAGLEHLAFHWSGPEAEVMLRHEGANDSLVSAPSRDVPFLAEQLSRPTRTGERLQLMITSRNREITRKIEVLETSALPLPDGLSALENLSSDEAAIYAIWLATEGPPQWRLQGLSMLSVVAEENYMAWKTLRALRATQ